MRNTHQKLVCMRYNKDRDEYELWLSTDGGKEWGFSTGCVCQKGLRDAPEDEPMLISCRIMIELMHCLDLGYEAVPSYRLKI